MQSYLFRKLLATRPPHQGRIYVEIALPGYNDANVEWDDSACLVSVCEVLNFIRTYNQAAVNDVPTYSDNPVHITLGTHIITLQGDWTLGVIYLDSLSSPDDRLLTTLIDYMVSDGFLVPDRDLTSH